MEKPRLSPRGTILPPLRSLPRAALLALLALALGSAACSQGGGGGRERAFEVPFGNTRIDLILTNEESGDAYDITLRAGPPPTRHTHPCPSAPLSR